MSTSSPPVGLLVRMLPPQVETTHSRQCVGVCACVRAAQIAPTWTPRACVECRRQLTRWSSHCAVSHPTGRKQKATGRQQSWHRARCRHPLSDSVLLCFLQSFQVTRAWRQQLTLRTGCSRTQERAAPSSGCGLMLLHGNGKFQDSMQY